MAECPHERIEHCPLYVEAHNPRRLGCIDDLAEPCRVERGEMEYAVAVAKLRGVDPRLVAQCEFSAQAWQDRQQRERNFRCNGIH